MEGIAMLEKTTPRDSIFTAPVTAQLIDQYETLERTGMVYFCVTKQSGRAFLESETGEEVKCRIFWHKKDAVNYKLLVRKYQETDLRIAELSIDESIIFLTKEFFDSEIAGKFKSIKAVTSTFVGDRLTEVDTYWTTEDKDELI